MPFIPHTDKDVQEMLHTIGVENIEELFSEIPKEIRAKLFDLPKGMTEWQVKALVKDKIKQDPELLSFIGAGAYEHHIPAVVWEIASRGEFMTAYTPYQAEASQGLLQVIFEFQSMIASLTGHSVANASLYDGATALAEAILMACRLQRKLEVKTILIPENIHPNYFEVISTLVTPQGIILRRIPIVQQTGLIDYNAFENLLSDNVTAVVIQQPNFYGGIEAQDQLCDLAHKHGVFVIASANPTSLAVLKAPGNWGEHGADIACGEGQPLGIPLFFGGPYFGFMTTKKEYVRQLPGRIVGMSKDLDKNTGFTLTLQAREQHIRRARATSNICTNQGLLVTAASIYMSVLGPQGLTQVAKASAANARSLINRLQQELGLNLKFKTPFFHEFALELPIEAEKVCEQMLEDGIIAGLDLGVYSFELAHALLIAVTEIKTDACIEKYVSSLKRILS